MENNQNNFADKYKLRSSRLSNWDYSTPGYYFITICTYNHNNFFGKIIDNKMELSKMGEIANQCLVDIPKHFQNTILDEYIVMPNYVHSNPPPPVKLIPKQYFSLGNPVFMIMLSKMKKNY